MPTNSNLTIFVPTWNAARHLDLTLGYYRELGITPTLIVDSKTTDGTMDIARRFDCPVVPAFNPTTRAQYIVEHGAKSLSTDWALRMDDDEVPSQAMLDYIDMTITTLPEGAIVGFPRHQCTIRDGKLLSSIKHTSHQHLQWRLFQPSAVEYIERGHTPGFEIPSSNTYLAPDDAAMVHFDWVVHSPAERDEKIKRYDAHTPNHGSAWRDYYLADTMNDFDETLVPLHLPEMSSLVYNLEVRFSPLVTARKLR